MRRHGTSGCWEQRLRQPLGCLAYDLKLANDRVLPVRGGDENITTHQDVALDFFDRVQNMREIKLVTFHRLTASLRTCSRM